MSSSICILVHTQDCPDSHIHLALCYSLICNMLLQLISDHMSWLPTPAQINCTALHSLAKCFVHEVGVVDPDDALVFLEQTLLP